MKRRSWEFWHSLAAPLVGDKISVDVPGVKTRRSSLEGQAAGAQSWATAEDSAPLPPLLLVGRRPASGEALQRVLPSRRSFRLIFISFHLPGEGRAVGFHFALQLTKGLLIGTFTEVCLTVGSPGQQHRCLLGPCWKCTFSDLTRLADSEAGRVGPATFDFASPPGVSGACYSLRTPAPLFLKTGL